MERITLVYSTPHNQTNLIFIESISTKILHPNLESVLDKQCAVHVRDNLSYVQTPIIKHHVLHPHTRYKPYSNDNLPFKIHRATTYV